MRTAAVISFAILAALIVQANGKISSTIHFDDPVLQISFWLPDGFKKDPQNEFVQGRFAFLKRRGGTPSQSIQFSIDGIGDRLSQESNYQLRGSFETDLGFPVSWNNLCLHVERLLEWHKGLDEPLVSYMLLLPVEPEAISVRMVGMEGIEPEMRQLFLEFVAKIRGETTWEPDECDQVTQPQ